MPTEALKLTDLDLQAIATAKALTADAVEKAGSGHPGAAISLAAVAHLLYQHELRVDPADPAWLGRDRFILSIGHASLLQYCALLMAGFGLEPDDFKTLRQWGSPLPAHPEYGHTAGVETTTGPLGAGFSNAVGMAIAARRQHGLLDPQAAPGESVFDHFVYTILGDGCMQEGVTAEAASLAGTQQLGNLIAIYDDNDISIEGSTNIAYTADTSAEFAAYGWQVLDVDWRRGPGGYAEDLQALHEALVAARAETKRPSLIRLHTIIAWPCPTKAGSAASHGAKLGAEEVAGLKRELGLDPEQSFAVPEGLLAAQRSHAAERAAVLRADWDARFAAWRSANPERATLLERLRAGELPEGFDAALPTFELGTSLATRSVSGKTLAALAPVMPELWGGSADLGGSNNTTMAGEPSFLPTELAQREGDGPYGRTLHFGVREHAMGSILNGIALEGLTRPYGGTFLVFADYMRAPVRLAALMRVPSIFVWSHDSIGVGEDGPTHQPVEHLASLRAIPGLDVVRPGDANETVAAWAEVLRRRGGPAGMILTRQNLPVVVEPAAARAGVHKGAYVVAEATGGDGVGAVEGTVAGAAGGPAGAGLPGASVPRLVLVATGSELAVALGARELLQAQGVPTRVVSAPCLEWFAEQDEAYRAAVLPREAVKVSVEAGIGLGWREYVGDDGAIVSLDHFGASAPAAELFERYGFTAEKVASVAQAALEAAGR
ncbi:Transketolase [Actinomyces bovis]|uniref:Transketolase n=1 Tax=Actinomyces bovis TaxID=1658 RepID=A0ABY1VMK5_9ACTO|nr:transketolase [Actinomyces bovis]SPT52987.1 Transketolase [Actinomyces bovis]VEG55214.1 Transketolase [Actinomyces israelii]